MSKPIDMDISKPLIIILVFVNTLMVVAQEENFIPMVTDRPDATESPSTVPIKSLQVETGGFYTSLEENNLKTEVYGYNTTLLRYGLLNNLKLRLGWNFEEARFKQGSQELNNKLSGFSPLLAGVKVSISEEKGIMPEIGLLGRLYLPFTASKDYRPENTGADFRFSFAHTISENSSLAYNLGAQWLDDNGELSYVYTLVYGYAISEKFGVYAEIYGDLPENNRSNHFGMRDSLIY